MRLGGEQGDDDAKDEEEQANQEIH